MRTHNRSAAVATWLAALLAIAIVAGCASPQPQPEDRPRLSVVVPAPPETALSVLRSEAMRLGASVTRESADSFTADFGVAPRRLEVRTGGDSAPARTAWLDTEVHSAATYSARRTEGGSLVTITQDSAWWHPERRVWLRLAGGESADPAPPRVLDAPR